MVSIILLYISHSSLKLYSYKMGKLFKTNEWLKNGRELVEAYPYVQKLT
jgi:hypothetical protein